MFSHCVSFSSLRVNTNVSYTLLYHPHTTGKRPSFFFFRFCGDARGYYVFFYAPTTTFFRFVETSPPPFETWMVFVASNQCSNKMLRVLNSSQLACQILHMPSSSHLISSHPPVVFRIFTLTVSSWLARDSSLPPTAPPHLLRPDQHGVNEPAIVFLVALGAQDEIHAHNIERPGSGPEAGGVERLLPVEAVVPLVDGDLAVIEHDLVLRLREEFRILFRRHPLVADGAHDGAAGAGIAEQDAHPGVGIRDVVVQERVDYFRRWKSGNTPPVFWLPAHIAPRTAAATRRTLSSC